MSQEIEERPADGFSNEKSTMREEPEDAEDSEPVQMIDGDAYDKMSQSKTIGSEQMFAQFLNVTRQFTATLEDMRKQQLMQETFVVVETMLKP